MPGARVAELFLGKLPVERNVPLQPFTTLKAGGPAERFAIARTSQDLADACIAAHRAGVHLTLLGMGSNVLPSDKGVKGLVLLNAARRIAVARTGEVLADTGCVFQELFLKSAQAGLKGLSFAVGIPGTLGGALVSNAGAYRSSISDFLTELEVVYEGERKWVSPSFLKFSYRDSLLRSKPGVQCVVVRVRMKLSAGDEKAIYDEAREYQRQRISKQPPPASAGSFFKNVNDRSLADRLEGLPRGLREAGVVPAGFLIEAAGLKGYRLGGTMFGEGHANFILNVGKASASEIRALAEHGKARVFEVFGVRLEEEVLYLGEW